MIRPATSRAIAAAVVLVVGSQLAAAASASASPDQPGPSNSFSNTAVRSGSHPDYGRLVIETGGAAAYKFEQAGDRLAVRFADDIILGQPPAAPRNVLAITTDGSTLFFTIRHGAQIHPMRMDGRVVIDIMDFAAGARPGWHPPLSMASSPELGGRAAAASGAPPATTTAERTPVATQKLPPPGASRPGQTAVPLATDQTATAQASAEQIPLGQIPPGQTPPDRTPVVRSTPAPSTAQTTQQVSPGRDVMPESEGPLALLARRVKLPKEMDGTGFLIPFDAGTAAASFRSGDNAYIVFDERRPVDMSALRSDPALSAASIQLLPSGTLLRMPLAPSQSIALTQLPQGWRVAALNTATKQQPIVSSFGNGHLDLAAEQPGDVVSLADPDTGATLLIGTQHRPGQGLASIRRGAEFVLRPTTQGVAVEALADAIVLQQTATGFSLTGGAGGLLLSPPSSATDALMGAALLTRRLSFSTIPPEALIKLAKQQINDAAAAPPLARGLKNHLAAQSLLSLGMAAEAEGVLHMAAEQDPKEAASADTAALAAIAALLTGRPREADALTDPRLDGTDEISLWRAVRQAMQDDGSPGAAAALAATAPLVFQYPAAIQQQILPLIAETMIEGGEPGAAARLLDQRKDDPRLDYARAMVKQADGDTDQALNMLDALANGRDQFDRARAAVRAVELRLATRKLDNAAAADALDKLLYTWRGDARDLALRERIAVLRGQTGEWRTALAILRQAESDFPEQAAPIHQRLKDVFAAMVRDQGEHQLAALDFVAAVDENADLMPGPGGDEAVQQSLADRLVALDLPQRAKPVLEKLMRSAKSDVAKARFGVSLARLESREGNNAGAQAALDASEAHELPADLSEQRAIVRAKSVAGLGDPSAAVAMLAPLRTGRATEARAEILENARDWAGAEQAWSDNLGLTLPESGMLDTPQTRALLRLATATARAGDDAALVGLGGRYGSRIGPGPLADTFRLLIAQPIKTTADIKRSGREVSLAASLPAGLKAVQAGLLTR